jgi:glyoxylase-like metal-dependent hydrolase (beta-lactamase superfamily II)
VRAGVWSIPVPMPDHPLRYVLVYAFEVPDGLALVDAGWPDDEAWNALVTGVAGIGYHISDVRSVFLTHVHIDHHGLAARIRAASGAVIGMHRLEHEIISGRPEFSEQLNASIIGWLTARGAPYADAAEMAGPTEDLAVFLSMADPDLLLADGDQVLGGRWDLRAVWTPGHTPGHLCYAESTERLFLSGDHVLPRISPNVSLQPDQAPNPLADYLDSLRRVRPYDDSEVLPAHEYRFAGLRGRCDALLSHHETRLQEMVGVMSANPGATTYEIASRVSWSRGWAEVQGYIRRAAVTETLAHLVLLQHRGVISSADGDVDSWRLR